MAERKEVSLAEFAVMLNDGGWSVMSHRGGVTKRREISHFKVNPEDIQVFLSVGQVITITEKNSLVLENPWHCVVMAHSFIRKDRKKSEGGGFRELPVSKVVEHFLHQGMLDRYNIELREQRLADRLKTMNEQLAGQPLAQISLVDMTLRLEFANGQSLSIQMSRNSLNEFSSSREYFRI